MKSIKQRFVDIFLLFMTVLPFILGIVLRVLTKPASEGVSISGAQVFFVIPMPLQDLPITEAQVNSWIVIISLTFLCLYLTHGIQKIPSSRRQLVAELIVEKATELVKTNMGERFLGFAPFVAAIMALSAFSSLSSMLGLFPPTTDLNIIAGWAILVFALITHYKLKGGAWNYVKDLAAPVPILLPINLIGELSTPIAMSFRHYGNVLSGVVISALVATGLSGGSALLFGWLPGFLGDIPFLQIGIPAVLSLYLDIFSGCLQAFIFAILTMLYISNGFPGEAYEERMRKKAARAAAKRAAREAKGA